MAERHRYTAQEKADIVNQIVEGKSVAEVAESSGVSGATIRTWLRKPKVKKEVAGPTPVTAEGIKAELSRFDRRVEELKAQIEQVEKDKQAYLDNLKAVLESIAQ